MTTKNILLLFFLVGIYPSLIAQTVSIPDAAFKTKLLSHTPLIDTNNDNQIQFTEAENFKGMLNVAGTPDQNGNIEDMTGLEAFINITGLNCRWNQLSALDTSGNTKLQTLICYNNTIATINVSNNLVLEELGISSNQLTAIDISANINLKIFTGSFNSFHSLDFSNNTALESIECYFCELDTVILGDLPNVDTLLLPNNNLANLDISGLDALSFIIIRFNDLKNLDTTQNNLLEIAVIHNNNFIDLNFNTNEALHILECSNNESLGNINLNNENNLNFDTTTNSSSNFTNLPLLNTVCLDDVESDLAAFILEQVAHDVTFLENCTLGSATERQTVIAIYPNPVKDFITIENREYRLDYRLYDTHGSLILESINNVYRYVQLDVSSLENGIYFMEIHTLDGENTIKKIIKY